MSLTLAAIIHYSALTYAIQQEYLRQDVTSSATYQYAQCHEPRPVFDGVGRDDLLAYKVESEAYGDCMMAYLGNLEIELTNPNSDKAQIALAMRNAMGRVKSVISEIAE